MTREDEMARAGIEPGLSEVADRYPEWVHQDIEVIARLELRTAHRLRGVGEPFVGALDEIHNLRALVAHPTSGSEGFEVKIGWDRWKSVNRPVGIVRDEVVQSEQCSLAT